MPLELLFDEIKVVFQVATEPTVQYEEADSTDRVRGLNTSRQAMALCKGDQVIDQLGRPEQASYIGSQYPIPRDYVCKFVHEQGAVQYGWQRCGLWHRVR